MMTCTAKDVDNGKTYVLAGFRCDYKGRMCSITLYNDSENTFTSENCDRYEISIYHNVDEEETQEYDQRNKKTKKIRIG